MKPILEKPKPTKTQAVTKALLNVKNELGLSNDVVVKIIGTDLLTFSIIQKDMDIEEHKVYEASLLMIRAYRSLYAIFGGSNDAMQHWLNTNNRDFEQRTPLDSMTSNIGLMNTVEYLEAMRERS